MPTTPEPEVVRAAGMLLFLTQDARFVDPVDETIATKRTEKFLLMRHADRWDLPKGHCDGDETFTAAAIREVEEETGITSKEIDIDSSFQFDLRYPVTYRRHGSKIFDKHVRYFLGTLKQQPEIHVTEHESFRWFDWNPPHQIQAETIDPLLAAVAQHLKRSE